MTTDSRGPGPLFAVSLASVSLIGPLAIHLFLPAIPAVKAALGLSDAFAQLTVSISLFGMAISTLVYGSLADRHGRRPVLLSGLALFLLGSAICAVADSGLTLIAGRLIQATGAGCSITLVRTMARDAYGPQHLVKAIAYLTMFYTLGPMVSPVIGGMLVDLIGWRSVFALALLAGAAVTTAAWLVVYETRRDTAERHQAGSILRDYAELLSYPRVSAFVLQSAFNTGAFMTMATASSTLMKELMARPATEFGAWFVLFPAGYFSGSLISTRLGERASTDTVVLAGSLILFAAVALQGALLMSGHLTPLAIFLPGFMVTLSQGIALPYGQAGAMAAVPRLAGTAAGIGVFMQNFCGAAFAQLYGALADGTPTPMILTAGASALLCLVTGAIPFALSRQGR
jgi:MFS transporter, DHA1 family, multidrug resistance protein